MLLQITMEIVTVSLDQTPSKTLGPTWKNMYSKMFFVVEPEQITAKTT